MLSKDWNQRKQQNDFIITGSGYGGAITAPRITAASSKPSVCIADRLVREYDPAGGLLN